MNANELAVYLEDITDSETSPYRQAATMLRNQQALIENLNGRIERMIEKQSHYEAMAHAGGFEAGRQQGMKQERALWQLAASTQEIEK
jgi:ATP phosphoribosyltransferase